MIVVLFQDLNIVLRFLETIVQLYSNIICTKNTFLKDVMLGQSFKKKWLSVWVQK